MKFENMHNPNTNIIRLTLSGFSWNIAGNIARSLTGFGVNILLARLLGPEPFGIVALAMIVIGLGGLIAESGLGTALIQKKDLNDADISFIFTIQMGVGILFTVCIFFFAPWIAFTFSNPNVTDILRVLAFLMIIQSFSQVPTALLRRELNFKRLQQAQIISYLIGYLGLGLPLAYAGLGVWSLISAQFAQAIINTAIVYFASKHSLVITITGSKELSGFGMKVLGANIANWIIQNIDNVIIGRQFGTTALGFYSRSYFLSWTPLGIILTSAQMALLSSVSHTGKGHQTAKTFLAFFGAFSVLLMPAYALVALGAKEFILIAYGKDWLPAADLLVPLALAMPLFALMGLEGPVLNGLGRPGIELRSQWMSALIALIILYISSQISLPITAWSIIGIYLFRFLVMSYQTIFALELQFSQLTQPLVSGLFLSMLVCISWFGIGYWLPKNDGLFFNLLIQISIVVIVWAITLALGYKWLFPEFKSLMHFLSPKAAAVSE